MTIEILGVNEAPAEGIGFRPLVNKDGRYVTNAQTGRVQVGNSLFRTNSVLLEREWDRVDAGVIAHPRILVNAMQDLIDRGLVEQLPNLGVMQSSWRVSTERRIAEANMDGRTRIDEDRTDRELQGVPVPIIAAGYRIGWRELLASRNGGAPIDTTEAMEAGRSVAEKQEQMMFVGDTSIVVGTNTIYGYTNHPQRTTDTATNYGGGDFGTIANIYPVFQNVLSALAGNRYRDQVGVYVSTTQYHQMNARFTDGSGQTARQAVLENLGVQAGGRIAFIKEADTANLSDGELVFVQLTKDVVDVAVALSLTNREWQSPDGQEFYAKVMAATVPRIKEDATGNVGVVHVTGA